MYNYQNIIKQAPLQAYCAVLTFIPKSNQLGQHFRPQRHHLIAKTSLVQADRPKPKDNFNYVSDLAFTLDSRSIASGSNFPAIRFWDASTGKPERRFEAGAQDKLSGIAISRDGRTIAGGSDDFTIMAWDVQTGKTLFRHQAHQGWVNSVAFSPDGRLLASGSMDGTVAFWDALTGEERLPPISNQSSAVNSIAFSPDGWFLATGSVDDLVRIWSTSGKLHMTLYGHSGAINSVRFSPSGRQLISCSDDMTIRLWDMSTGASSLPPFRGHMKRVTAVAVSTDFQFIASGSEDKTVKIWSVIDGTLVHTIRDLTSGVNSVLFSPNDRVLAACSFDDEVQLWSTATWDPIGRLGDFEADVHAGLSAVKRSLSPSPGLISSTMTYKGHSKSVNCLVSSPNSAWLASGSQDTTIKLFLRQKFQWELKDHTGGIKRLIFSPDSNMLASSSIDRTVRLWDCSKGSLLHTLKVHTGAILGVAFSPDGKLLGTSSADHTICLWDPSTGENVADLSEHKDAVNGLAFSPDGRHIVSWSDDRTARLWDVSTRKQIAVLKGHTAAVNSVAFSSDGQLLASCAEDQKILFWNRNGKKVDGFNYRRRSATVVAWSPDNRLIAMGSTDSKVQLLSLDSMMIEASIDTGIVIRQMSFSSCGQFITTDRGTLSVASIRGDRAALPSPSASSHVLSAPELFVTRDWLKRGMVEVLQLPEEYTATDVAVVDNLAVIGHSSGAISFVLIGGSSRGGTSGGSSTTEIHHAKRKASEMAGSAASPPNSYRQKRNSRDMGGSSGKTSPTTSRHGNPPGTDPSTMLRRNRRRSNTSSQSISRVSSTLSRLGTNEAPFRTRAPSIAEADLEEEDSDNDVLSDSTEEASESFLDAFEESLLDPNLLPFAWLLKEDVTERALTMAYDWLESPPHCQSDSPEDNRGQQDCSNSTLPYSGYYGTAESRERCTKRGPPADDGGEGSSSGGRGGGGGNNKRTKLEKQAPILACPFWKMYPWLSWRECRKGWPTVSRLK